MEKKIASIEKLVGEYMVWELYITPGAKFKIRIYNDGERFKGISNIQVIDSAGDYCSAIGFGFTEEEALQDTIDQYFELLSWKDDWKDQDFQWMSHEDF